MKSKHIIAITALTFASLTSCTSVLDKDDLTAVSEKATWNSEILDRKSTRLNSSHYQQTRMPSSA